MYQIKILYQNNIHTRYYYNANMNINIINNFQNFSINNFSHYFQPVFKIKLKLFNLNDDTKYLF